MSDQAIPTQNKLSKSRLSAELGLLLSTQNLLVTTAESCTGGGIAEAITRIAGSSRWFSHGFVTYSNEAKSQLLNVSPSLIEKHGAVSQPVVEAMALGAQQAANADFSIAVSGVAGPDGGTVNKPVGTVWIGWCQRECDPFSTCYQFSGNRKSIRKQTVIESLQGLIHLIEKNTV